MIPSQENNNIQGRIEAELIRLLYRNAVVVIIGSGAAAIILLILMWKVVPLWLSISWIMALLILYSVRLYWITEISRNNPTDEQTPVWGKRFIAGALLSGLLWGSAGILIFIYGPDDYYHTAMLILCGLAAASMITHAPVLRSYSSFILPTIVPIIIAPFIKWNFFDVLLGVLAFVFMTAMIVLASQINTVLRNELRLRFMNEELADSLRESEEKYRIVSEFTYDWEYWQAPDRSYRYISPSCEQFTGYSSQEFIDNPKLYMSIIYPDDLPMILEHSAGFEKNDYENIDFRIIHKDGSMRWISHSCRSIHDEKGNFLGRRVSNRDITDRKKTEESLKESEARFRSAMENAPIGMALVSIEGKFLQVNNALCVTTGYDKDELEKLTFQEITYFDDLELDIANTQKLLKGEISSYSMEKRYIRKNGDIVWVQFTESLVRDENGNPLYFIKQVEDIDERKHAEEKLKESEANLAKAQMIAHIGHWDWNIITNKLYWSDEIYRIFGFTPNQFEATYDDFLDTIHPDDRDMVVAAVNDAINNNKPYNIEHRIVHPDGSIRIVNEQGEVTRDESGKAARMIGTVQDITERKQYEEKLKEANASKDKFFSIIAHDLKNPFNALLGSAQAFHDNIDDFDKEDLHDMSNIIYRSAKNAYALLENLLEWSRSQLDRLDIRPHDLNLRDIVHESIMIVEGQAENKQITLLNTVYDVTVYADTNLLKTILRNLLSNAIKYTNTGGTVTVSSRQNGDKVEVSVTDTGVGMPTEVMEKIFKIDTKYSTPGTEKETGTGLGLVLCKEFVERQGGRIWVESEVGKGTAFIFTLPKR